MPVDAPAQTIQHSSFAKVDFSVIAIICLALILRTGAAFYHGDSVDILPGIHDQISYHELAQRVLTGYGFSFAEMHWPLTRENEPTAHWSFLYTLYLSATYAVVGVHPLVARVIQVFFVSIFHIWLVFRLGNRLFSRSTGLWSAAMTAIYIYFVYYSGALMTEALFITGILWSLDCALRINGGDRRLRRWAELGLAIGLTMLMRQVFGLFVPFLFLWVLWARYSDAERQGPTSKKNIRSTTEGHSSFYLTYIRGMAMTSLIVALLIAPWTIRNYLAFNQFVPLNTNSGYAFYWGNHPIYGTSFVGILPADGPSYQELIPVELRDLDEARLDKALLRRGIEIVTADPVRYIRLSLSRSREYFKFWPSLDSSTTSNFARVGSFGLVLPFIIYGFWLTGHRLLHGHYDQKQRQGIFLLILFILFYTVIHLLTWALVRYRLPVDAVLLLFAGNALCHIQRRTGILPAWSSES